jgi:hypothetical protein
MRPVLLLMLVAACAPTAASEVSTSEVPVDPSTTSTTTSVPVTTTSLPSDAMGLYRVEPATLEPLPGVEPLITADGVSGYSSPNGQWLALQLWSASTLQNLALVIESSTGEIVTEKSGILGDFLGVGDHGVVYQLLHGRHRGHTLRRLVPGGDRYEEVDVDFPKQFRNQVATFFAPQRIGFLGTFGENPEDRVIGVVVVDLKALEIATHMIEGLTAGNVAEMDLGDWSLTETVQSVAIWDSGRDRVIFVHGDADAVTTLDLGTGAKETHWWSSSTSWLDSLFAWLIPPAQAKGPSEYGLVRSADLGQSGRWLYVGTSVSEVVIESNEDWYIEHTPQGVEVVNTETWQVAHRWDIPASEISVSPDGRYVVASGTTWTESLTTSSVQAKDVFVIDADDHELAGQFRAFHAWPEIEFSPESDYMYIGSCCGGRFDIVDLATMEIVGRADGTLLVEAGLLVTEQP